MSDGIASLLGIQCGKYWTTALTIAVVEIVAGLASEECVGLYPDELSIREFIERRLPMGEMPVHPAHPPVHRWSGPDVFTDRLGTTDGLVFSRYLWIGPSVMVPLYEGKKRVSGYPMDVDWRFFTTPLVKL